MKAKAKEKVGPQTSPVRRMSLGARGTGNNSVYSISHVTLRASLSRNILQTLPDLVMSLKGALFISAQLSTDAVRALRKVWVLI